MELAPNQRPGDGGGGGWLLCDDCVDGEAIPHPPHCKRHRLQTAGPPPTVRAGWLNHPHPQRLVFQMAVVSAHV